MRYPRLFLIVPAVLFVGPILGQPPEPSRDVPPALAPLEFLVGSWKGQGVPRDNPSQRFRGWTETHTWAWAFEKGKPVGLTVSIKAGKVLAQGRLTYDAPSRRYRLEGKEPGDRGKAVVFTGTLDATGKVLNLERAEPSGGGTQRLSIRPNANFVRYVMTIDRKPAGSTAFAPKSEVGLTREGESLAAGASAVERPRCIVTGGAAAMSVSYQGQSYPVCCTGCIDEFKENPEKYLKKLASRKAEPAKGAAAAKPSGVSRFEDAFSGDSDDAPAPATDGKDAKKPPR
ncbi:YHS domain-containing protein [Aquisphaera insulae]|uniref:YHS domain-containing protein n=1 Tax=Aquisphaera insulae TaxID=2712864 RepID=UPI0013ED16A4|nr:YHS domain-containing protein [Aquisphaera insulae]